MARAVAQTASRPNLFAVLRIRNYALLWSGQAVSQVGDGLFYVAQIWLVLQLTGSALAMGTTLILTQIPRLAFQLIGGVSVDRYDRQKLMLLSDVIRGIVVLAFAILVATNRVQMIHVYLLSIVFGIVGAFFYPAQAALTPNLVPPDRLHEGCELFRFTQPTRPKSFQRRDQNLLRKVIRSLFVSQVTQSIQPNTRSHPAEQLGLRLAVASEADLPHQLSIVQFDIHPHIFYV